MHRSRIQAIMIDVPEAEFAAAVEFWASTLGRQPSKTPSEADPYLDLLADDKDPAVAFQRISGEARIHLDIETDDVEAEVSRLVSLGARVSERVENWVVLQDPAGLLFCVVPKGSSDFSDGTAAGK